MTLPPAKYSWAVAAIAAIAALILIAFVTFGVGHHSKPVPVVQHAATCESCKHPEWGDEFGNDCIPAAYCHVAKKIVAKPIAISYPAAQEKKHVWSKNNKRRSARPCVHKQPVGVVSRYIQRPQIPHKNKYKAKHHPKKHHHKVPHYGHNHHHQAGAHQGPHHAPSYPNCGYQGFSCGP